MDVREKMEHLEMFPGLLPISQGRNLALAVLHVPYSFDSGLLKHLLSFGTPLGGV